MNTANAIGIRMVGITLLAVFAIFGAWKGVEWGVRKIQSTKEQPSILPSFSPVIASQPVDTPLPPKDDVDTVLSSIDQTAQQTFVGYTKKYIESLPTDIPRDEVLDQKNVQGFVDANRGVLLATLPAGTIKTTTASDKKAIQTYLDSISASHNKAIAPVTGTAIIDALGKQQSGEDLEALAPVRSSIEKNFELFVTIQAPKEAVTLHTKLLQATQSLVANVKLLQDMRTDIVAGLIGQRNLTDLNLVFADIASQIQALETKYKIE